MAKKESAEKAVRDIRLSGGQSRWSIHAMNSCIHVDCEPHEGDA